MKKTISNQSVKRAGSPIAGASGSEVKKRPPKQVVILEDVWLEALKHLTCPQWSKMRLVTRNLKGLVGINVSRLPLAVIDRAEVKYNERKRIEPKIIIADSPISPDAEWFKNGGTTIDVPAGIQLDKAIIGIELKDNFCADLCILGPAQKKKLTPYEKGRPWFADNSKIKWLPDRRVKSEVIFYGEFGPHRNQSSLASIAFFLKMLYDPSTYVKELFMYSIDSKLKDFLFPGDEERYIRCQSFHNRHEKTGASVDEVCEYVSWLEKNVKSDYMYFPDVIEQSINNPHTSERNIQICDVMTNFAFGASWISANQSVSLCHTYEPECFKYLFEALIKKFRTTTTAQSIFPEIDLYGPESAINDSLDKLLSEKDIVREKSVEKSIPKDETWNNRTHCSIKADNYIISNGSNRMRGQISRRGGRANVSLYRYFGDS